MLKLLLGDITKLCFPDTCLICRRAKPLGNEAFCLPCYTNLPFIEEKNDCAAALAVKGFFSNEMISARSLLYFEKKNLTQKLLHDIKYKGQKRIAIELGRRLGKSFLREENQPKALVPVPIHPEKLRSRGYNQAEIIAQGMQQESRFPIIKDLLQKRINEKSQTEKDAFQRRMTTIESYLVNEHHPINRNTRIIIVDDVITSGATMEACINALRKAGFGRIGIASLAITI